MAITEIENLPDISFIEDKTLADIRGQMVEDFQSKYEELTGSSITLARADPISLLIYAAAAQIYQTMLYVDQAGKMNLLKYSYGDFLDNLAALKGITRKAAEPATVTVRFTLSAVQAGAISIPIGTQVTNGQYYFVNTEYAEIAAGSLYADVEMTCLTDGAGGNGIAIGEIDTMVDPIAYVETVENLAETEGGTDEESDEDLRDRIYYAPSGYSAAGPKSGYIYWAKEYSSDVLDVAVVSPSASVVNVYFIVTGGALPSADQISGLQSYLDTEEIVPLTDQVTVQAPTAVSYDVVFTYYIARSDSSKVTTIQTAVSEAVAAYILWQQSAIGRDINPDKLVNLVISAGAKRVVLTNPSYTVISATSIGQVGTQTVTYGGLEDD